jgi:hypothetical protein
MIFLGYVAQGEAPMDQELRLIWLYCWIVDAVRSISWSDRLRVSGPIPELTDEEVLTLELWREMAGLASDAAIWRHARDSLRGWFPHLGAAWNFTRRCANLHVLKEEIQRRVFRPTVDWNAFDGLPLPVCKLARANRDKRFRGEAVRSYCAAKNEMYYGFKAGALMNAEGEIFRVWLGAANIDERVMLEAVSIATPGLLLADKGLISKELSAMLTERETSLTTPMRNNMRDDRPPSIIQHAMRLRRRIETAFGRLVDGFNITRTHGRDFRRWSARVCRKVLAYNVLLRLDRAMSTT